MRGDPAHHEVQVPASLSAALELIAREPGVWTPLAGGTDVMVLHESGVLAAKKLLSIWRLSELKGIVVTPTHAVVGALCTYGDIQKHPVLHEKFPSLVQAGRETGGIAIQSRGTVGGNIANASPAADSPPALLAYDAELELVSRAGTRIVPYHGFHTGYKQTLLRPDELIRAVRLPLPTAPRVDFYRKVGTRKAQAISKVVLCATATRDGAGTITAARIALGSVGPTTVRCTATEALITGKTLTAALVAAAEAALLAEIAPIDDIRSTRDFRRAVAGNLLRAFLAAAGRA